MNRRYIDFAPTKKGGASPRGTVSGARRSTSAVRSGASQAGGAYVSVTRTSSVNTVRGGATRASGAGASRVGEAQVSVSRTSAPRVSTARASVTRVSAPRAAQPTVKMPNGVARGRRATGSVTISRGSSSASTRISRAEAGDDGRMTLSKSRVKLGEIEELNQKFVTKDVPKRPLGSSNGGAALGFAAVNGGVISSGVTEAKAKKVGSRFRRKKSSEKTTGKRGAAKNGAKENFAVPNSPFINQDKVVKRPLSKNVYQKKAVVPTNEKQEGVVRIVTQPKKESHAGMIVAVILTIILGAVAGTVAFLLLPK